MMLSTTEIVKRKHFCHYWPKHYQGVVACGKKKKKQVEDSEGRCRRFDTRGSFLSVPWEHLPKAAQDSLAMKLDKNVAVRRRADDLIY